MNSTNLFERPEIESDPSENSSNNPLQANSVLNSAKRSRPEPDATYESENGPEFGMIDIVEAFTALRHEWKGQTRTSRDAAESIQAAVAEIRGLEARFKQLVTDAAAGMDDYSFSKKLVGVMGEIDIQLERAIHAAAKFEENESQRFGAIRSEVQAYFRKMNFLGRWFARPLLAFIGKKLDREAQHHDSPTLEGLRLIWTQHQNAMKDVGIQRIETAKTPFDPETMNAIGSAPSTEDFPQGSVVDQLSPGYSWRGTIVRFAIVKVAN